MRFAIIHREAGAEVQPVYRCSSVSFFVYYQRMIDCANNCYVLSFVLSPSYCSL